MASTGKGRRSAAAAPAGILPADLAVWGVGGADLSAIAQFFPLHNHRRETAEMNRQSFTNIGGDLGAVPEASTIKLFEIMCASNSHVRGDIVVRLRNMTTGTEIDGSRVTFTGAHTNYWFRHIFPVPITFTVAANDILLAQVWFAQALTYIDTVYVGTCIKL